MVLESTMICVDNSEYMRNGDYIPTRLQAQQDAVSLVCHSKTRSNPENNVGLVTMAKHEVLVTLTSDVGHILAKLHQVTPEGEMNLPTGIRVAHLALKHRQSKNHKTRIVAFVGSPINMDEKDLVKLAKRLKKEKVNVDVINFGEDAVNADKLQTFINTLNGKDGTSSHLVTVPPGPQLSDALLSSPIIQGEDGAGVGVGIPGGPGDFEFGVDPSADPELALALRVSMEEQRARQEAAARRAGEVPAPDTGTPQQEGGGAKTDEERMLEQALVMSMGGEATPQSSVPQGQPNFASMTEDEQIALALQMSLQQSQEEEGGDVEPMDVDEGAGGAKASEEGGDQVDENYDDLMGDTEFLQRVLQDLPGVDPTSDAVQSALTRLKTEGKEGSKAKAGTSSKRDKDGGTEGDKKKKKEGDEK